MTWPTKIHQYGRDWVWIMTSAISLNIAKAIKAGLFAQPLPPCTTEKKKAYLMVNNRLTFQEQSWVPKAGKGTHLVLIPTAREDNQEVTAIIEEHMLFLNLHIIVLMFTYES